MGRDCSDSLLGQCLRDTSGRGRSCFVCVTHAARRQRQASYVDHYPWTDVPIVEVRDTVMLGRAADSTGGRGHIARATARRIEFEISAAVVPVGQHEPFALAAVDDKMMPRRAMRVAMNHPDDVRVAKRGFDGFRRDVHDLLRLP